MYYTRSLYGQIQPASGQLQLRVLTLTLLFTLGVSIVITVSNMHQLNAEWERTTLLNAEYALQTAAAAIYRDLDEVDDLASWCACNPSMRTYLLTHSAGNNQALSMYPMISAKYNSMRTLPYIQRFMLINAAGRRDDVRHGCHQCRGADPGSCCRRSPATTRPATAGRISPATRWR